MSTAAKIRETTQPEMTVEEFLQLPGDGSGRITELVQARSSCSRAAWR